MVLSFASGAGLIDASWAITHSNLFPQKMRFQEDSASSEKPFASKSMILHKWSSKVHKVSAFEIEQKKKWKEYYFCYPLVFTNKGGFGLEMCSSLNCSLSPRSF